LVQTSTNRIHVVYCKNIHGLMSQLILLYEPFKWRLFIYLSKSGLKAVLLHNGNIFSSISMANSINLKENYKDLVVILQKPRYEEYGWMICADFKVISTLLGQKLGFTKYPCFLCMWDSRARDLHWLVREVLTPGSSNITSISLVPRDKNFATTTSY